MRPDDPLVQKMRQIAMQVSENAYCPYSKFRVGAAVLTDSGEIFGACNVENASFGLTICAERSAVFQAVARGHQKIKAVVVDTATDSPTPPCGACRQVINEFGSDAEIFCFAKNGRVMQFKLSQLLPSAFGPSSF